MSITVEYLYGELSEFRCLLDSGTQFALFTATATQQTKLKVMSMLDIDMSQTFFLLKRTLQEKTSGTVFNMLNVAQKSLNFRLSFK